MILFCGNFIVNVFFVFIGVGVLFNMRGVFGYEFWRWFFFIEGKLLGFKILVELYEN